MEIAATPSATVNAMSTNANELPSLCPRCGGDISSQEYYGVCPSCADSLRDRYDGVARDDVSAAEYEPKMNVTPNAVALKE